MEGKRFTKEQIIGVLNEAEQVGNIREVCRLHTDVYFGRRFEVLTERSKIKRRTMERRKKEYLAAKAA
jgi:hypothetical protein